MMSKQPQQLKIIITGGHLTPALAVLEEMQSQGFTNFTWVGKKYVETSSKNVSAEYKIITKTKSIPFYNLHTGKLWRRWTIKTLFKGIYNMLMIPVGLIQAATIVLTKNPDIILSFGGYVALPVVIAGKLMGKKVITHEQTLVSGLANKIIAKFADKILISWEDSIHNFPKNKTILTGNPVQKQIFEQKTSNFVFDNDLPVLYITGGNQGANTINRRIFPLLDKLLLEFNIIHGTGKSTLTKDYEKALVFREKLPAPLKQNYIVRSYIFTDEIGEAYQKADLVFSRSGANTCTDLLALGKPAVLIPIPWSYADEQLKNAKMLEHIGLATIIHQKDSLTAKEVFDVLLRAKKTITNEKGFNGQSLKSIQKIAKSKVYLDASRRIVEEIKDII